MRKLHSVENDFKSVDSTEEFPIDSNEHLTVTPFSERLHECKPIHAEALQRKTASNADSHKLTAYDINQFCQSLAIPTPVKIAQCTGGANNQVYLLQFSNRKPCILKRYFQHSLDSRKRLQSEFTFLSYAWKRNIRCIPKPIACHPNKNIALYSYCNGKPITSLNLTSSHVHQAVQFFLSLNQDKSKDIHLPLASEACFSADEYINLIEERINRLKIIKDNQLDRFLQTYLLPAWQKITKCTEHKHIPLIDIPDRCISPCDFGFHNALLHKDNSVTFIDFEYAGWDDPAKTVCDFFLQPRVPVPVTFVNQVTSQFLAVCQNPEDLLMRIRSLYPICKIKWCCIILNRFSHIGNARRAFAFSEEQKELQIEKAKHFLTHYEHFSWPI